MIRRVYFSASAAMSSCSVVSRWIPVDRPEFESSGSVLSIPVFGIMIESASLELAGHHRGPNMTGFSSYSLHTELSEDLCLSFDGLVLLRRSMDPG